MVPGDREYDRTPIRTPFDRRLPKTIDDTDGPDGLALVNVQHTVEIEDCQLYCAAGVEEIQEALRRCAAVSADGSLIKGSIRRCSLNLSRWWRLAALAAAERRTGALEDPLAVAEEI